METSGIIKIYHRNDCDDYYCDCDETVGNNIKKIYFQNAGKIEGVYEEYHFDGQFLYKINYINGIKHGEYIKYTFKYYDNSRKDIIETVCNYDNNKIIGELIHYDMDCNVERICHYDNGKRLDNDFCINCHILYYPPIENEKN